jgi:hypothetical protein
LQPAIAAVNQEERHGEELREASAMQVIKKNEERCYS